MTILHLTYIKVRDNNNVLMRQNLLQISSIIAQEGLTNSDVIHEITLNQTEDGQTVAVVSETSAPNHGEDDQPHHQVTDLAVECVVLKTPRVGSMRL